MKYVLCHAGVFLLRLEHRRGGGSGTKWVVPGLFCSVLALVVSRQLPLSSIVSDGFVASYGFIVGELEGFADEIGDKGVGSACCGDSDVMFICGVIKVSSKPRLGSNGDVVSVESEEKGNICS